MRHRIIPQPYCPQKKKCAHPPTEITLSRLGRWVSFGVLVLCYQSFRPRQPFDPVLMMKIYNESWPPCTVVMLFVLSLRRKSSWCKTMEFQVGRPQLRGTNKLNSNSTWKNRIFTFVYCLWCCSPFGVEVRKYPLIKLWFVWVFFNNQLDVVQIQDRLNTGALICGFTISFIASPWQPVVNIRSPRPPLVFHRQMTHCRVSSTASWRPCSLGCLGLNPKSGSNGMYGMMALWDEAKYSEGLLQTCPSLIFEG